MNRAISFALSKAGRGSDFGLKQEQKAIIEAIVCSKKDVLGVLPTGFGKSLIFHLMSDIFNFVETKGSPSKTPSSITIVISPLNALMRDQISKLDHLEALILDGSKKSLELAREGKLDILFSHPEVLLEKSTKSILKRPAFQKNVRCIVVDEAHLVDDW